MKKEEIPFTVEREFLKKYSAQDLLLRIIKAHAGDREEREEEA